MFNVEFHELVVRNLRTASNVFAKESLRFIGFSICTIVSAVMTIDACAKMADAKGQKKVLEWWDVDRYWQPYD